MGMGGSPVLIVPGLMGSTLWVQQASGAAINRIWQNHVAMGIGRWKWLEVAPNGVSPILNYPALVPRTILFDFYAPLVDQLLDLGWDVDGFFYDWRQSVVSAGNALVAKIQGSYKGLPINLVCHSMGGLVARWACEFLISTAQRHKIGRVVSLGTPHWGSWEAGGGLSCRGWPTSLLAGLLAALDVLSPTGPSFDLLQQVSCSWPSMYQLMPSPLAPGLTLEQAIALYDEETWTDQRVPVSAGWMAVSFNLWQHLPPLPSGVPWLSCAGIGVSTANGPDASGICPLPDACPHTLAGDGTVPLAYAYYQTEPVLRLPLSHDTIAQSWQAVAAVDTWLRGGTPSGAAPIPRSAQPSAQLSSEVIQSAIRSRAVRNTQSPSASPKASRPRVRTYRS